MTPFQFWRGATYRINIVYNIVYTSEDLRTMKTSLVSLWHQHSQWRSTWAAAAEAGMDHGCLYNSILYRRPCMDTVISCMHVPPQRRTRTTTIYDVRGGKKAEEEDLGGVAWWCQRLADRCSRVRLAAANIWSVVPLIETPLLLLPVAVRRSAAPGGRVWPVSMVKHATEVFNVYRTNRSQPGRLHCTAHATFPNCSVWKAETESSIYCRIQHNDANGSCSLPDTEERKTSGRNYC